MENGYEIWKAKVRSLYKQGSLKAVGRKTHLVEVQNVEWNKSARIYVRLCRKKLHVLAFSSLANLGHGV
jgi:hypothetical protein